MEDMNTNRFKYGLKEERVCSNRKAVITYPYLFCKRIKK